jgi:hypothetical protein
VQCARAIFYSSDPLATGAGWSHTTGARAGPSQSQAWWLAVFGAGSLLLVSMRLLIRMLMLLLLLLILLLRRAGELRRA